MKSLLVLNGSPNEHGKTMTLVDALIEGVDARLFHAYRMDVASCDDCGLCAKKFACRHDDDAETLLDALVEASTFLVATPVYFGAPSDVLMRIVNRFQPLYYRKTRNGERLHAMDALVFVATCASEDPSMFEGPKAVFRLLEKLFEPRDVHTLLCEGTETLGPCTKRHAATIESIRKDLLKRHEK